VCVVCVCERESCVWWGWVGGGWVEQLYGKEFGHKSLFSLSQRSKSKSIISHT